MKECKGYKTGEGETIYIEKSAYDSMKISFDTMAELHTRLEAKLKIVIDVLNKLKRTYDIDLIHDTLKQLAPDSTAGDKK